MELLCIRIRPKRNANFGMTDKTRVRVLQYAQIRALCPHANGDVMTAMLPELLLMRLSSSISLTPVASVVPLSSPVLRAGICWMHCRHAV
jgi:hypothetical protein